MGRRKRNAVLAGQEELHEYCNSVRKISGSEFKYLLGAAQELRASLSGAGRVKAWYVSWHLVLAAQASKAASAHAVATYGAFLKWFEPELEQVRRKGAKSSKGKARHTSPSGGFEFGSE
jgi:hypothetical protein